MATFVAARTYLCLVVIIRMYFKKSSYLKVKYAMNATKTVRRVARNSQWGAVLGVWGRSPQPPEANGGLGAQKFGVFLQK